MRRPGLSAAMGKARQGWCSAELAVLGAGFASAASGYGAFILAAHPSVPQRRICSPYSCQHREEDGTSEV